MVVTDEAQRGKTPDTKTSHALKSLSPQFRVACTGTPVETRLADLWNIMDYLQPGRLLDSARAFEKEYLFPPEVGADSGPATAGKLKEKLRLGRPDAFLLRRDKSMLDGLHAKHEHVLGCKLSMAQRDGCASVLALARSGDAHPFQSLLALMRISEHPFLYPRYEPRPAEELIAACPKLAAVLDALVDIRRRGEKALIFARFLDTQEILRSALAHRFRIRAGIVSGASPRTGDSFSAKKTRAATIEEFQGEPGFGVLILSPEVAGFGLNLVEANHVFHYGRWWNPAKEDQATDRVYRLGQTREVHVYLPVAADPLGEFRSFDEGLDDLLRRRRRMAAAFLTPEAEVESLQQELFESVASGPAPETGVKQALRMEEVAQLGWRHFEALIAVMERKRGARVFVTPGSGDDRADVVAIAGTALRLIQCKHIASGAVIDDDALSQILSAVDIYRHRHLRSVEERFTIRPVVATNGMFSARAERRAQEEGLELISGRELGEELGRCACSLAEVAMEDGRRLRTMPAFREALAGV